MLSCYVSRCENDIRDVVPKSIEKPITRKLTKQTVQSGRIWPSDTTITAYRKLN